MEKSGVFNIRYNSTFSPDRVYRVYLRGNDLYFIRIGGQYWGIERGVEAGSSGGAHGLGLIGGLVVALVGALVGALWKDRAKASKKSLIQTLDQLHPEQLLDRHKHNFKLSQADFQESTIEPAARFASHGPHAGCWNSLLRNGKKLNLEFLTNEDMQIGLSLLPDTIGSVLKIDVQWNEKKKKFSKRGF